MPVSGLPGGRVSRSTTCSLRASVDEFAEWRGVAGRLGLSFNGWARRALGEQAALDLALLREREGSGSVDERGLHVGT